MFRSHLSANAPVRSIVLRKAGKLPSLSADIRLRFLFLREYFERTVRRCFTISKKELLINEEIREKEVRVVGSDGAQLGIMPTREALSLAVGQGLDLVDIAPQATPNVCRIMDYGKYRYEQAKREKEAKKNQKTVEVKEVRMSMNIDTHDFETKFNQASKFLKGGNKVKVSVRFRGREMTHTDLGKALLDKFVEACAECGSVDKPAKMEGRSMVVFLSPKPLK